MRNIQHYALDSVDSTQDWAKKNASKLDFDLLNVITSREQTKGRGRLNRHWFSPKDANLYVTFAFRLPKTDHSLNPITLVLALSIAEVLQKLGLRVQLKWPNDLYSRDQKLGGILAEVQPHESHSDVFLGFGLNVNMTADQLSSLDFKATSLLIETKRKWSLETLLSSVETTFLRDLPQFIEKGFEPFYKDFQEISFFKGKTICLDLEKEVIEGQYHSINKEGALVLKLKNGEEKAFLHGEIVRWQ